jgi:hypothetical protein
MLRRSTGLRGLVTLDTIAHSNGFDFGVMVNDDRVVRRS